MKKSFLKLLSALLVAVSIGTVVISAADGNTVISTAAQNDDGIKVFIDGERIKFDVEPEVKNGRTMVPVRDVFEHLGASVEWNAQHRSINASCGYLNVLMHLNDPIMIINDNTEVRLDASPYLINGRAFVPLRAVAEAFLADVIWNGDDRCVYINTKYPRSEYKGEPEFDKYHLRTSYGNTEYVDLTISGGILTVSGMLSDPDISSVGIKLGSRPLTYDNITDVKNDGTFIISTDLNSIGAADGETLRFSTRKSDESFYWAYIDNQVEICKDDSGFCFKAPLALENNKKLSEIYENPIGYIKNDIDPKLAELSDNICKDADSDYQKLLSIHNWVADNIYYDYDHYEGRSQTIFYRAADVYREKRTVCMGYSELFSALAHAQDIPCRVVIGVATQSAWTEETISAEKANHAWNQAYADGRWINIDTTWSSDNDYRNGEFIYGGIFSHLYFDISDVILSYDHKAISIK